MIVMQVLFVEDDDSQRQLFDDAVAEWNDRQNGRRLEVVHATTVAEAKAKLAQIRLDAALFDLRLPATAGAKGGAKGGSDLARLSLKQVGIPIGIISGNPADLDAELTALHLVNAFNKGDADVYAQVIAWLEAKWMMMTVMGAARQQIQASGAEVFVRRLWPRWGTYAGLTGADEDELTRIVARQYVSHVAETLGLDGEGNAPWHPFECFIQPALLEARAHTGDLFRIAGTLWVVLTPACDMATKKAETVLMVRIDESSQPEWASKVALLGDATLSNNAREKRDTYFKKLVNQNVDVSEHFLPPLNQGPPMMVRFKEVSTQPLAWLNENLALREASIASPFLSNLVQRFGAWISRTGQPDIQIRLFG